jgi:hypothetical protein
MKNQLKITGLGLVLAAFIFTTGSCTKDKTTVVNGKNIEINNIDNVQSQVNILPKESLSVEELNSLAFLREEEKLAMDVYITLYNKWGVKIFDNISKSENSHMSLVLSLLTKYDLPDPVGSNTVGIFKNTNLQALYNQLVLEGNKSPLNAYIVGATIEDLDLFDIKMALLKIDNQDIRYVFDILAKGSRNHMRSFYKNIVNAGGTYTPQYITNDEFKTIIESEMETGN